jgi:hypothetical protein
VDVILPHNDTRYVVTSLIADAVSYRLYIAHDEAAGTKHLVQIASELEHNNLVDQAAVTLGKLKRTADLFEARYAEENPDARPLGCEKLFPSLEASFEVETQEGRRANILTLLGIDNITKLVPLSNYRREHKRVELPTSAWILGRILKLLGLAHACGISPPSIGGGNVLIEPDEHRVIVINWINAKKHFGAIPEEEAASDIAKAARAVFSAVGGDPMTLDFPHDAEGGEQYIKLLRRLATQQEHDAHRAHVEFYDKVYALFGREFRPFQTRPL